MGYAKGALPYVIEKWRSKMKPGDVFALNDPYQGMSHLPDILLTAPVFWQGNLVAYAMTVAHQTDIGGRFPGGQAAPCAELYEEGLLIPNLRIYHEGAPDFGVLELIAANVRAPEDVIGDIEGLASACKRGIAGIIELLERYDRQTFEDCVDGLKAYSERIMRKSLAEMPDGDYQYDEFFEDDGLGGPGVNLRLTLKKWGDEIVADFTGTDLQAKTAINVPWGNTCSAVYMVCWYILAPTAIANAGVFRPIKVTAPEGCLVRPKFPGAVGARGMMLWRLTDMIAGAFGRALPNRSMAEGDGGTSSMTFISTDANHKVSGVGGLVFRRLGRAFDEGWRRRCAGARRRFRGLVYVNGGGRNRISDHDNRQFFGSGYRRSRKVPRLFVAMPQI